MGFFAYTIMNIWEGEGKAVRILGSQVERGDLDDGDGGVYIHGVFLRGWFWIEDGGVYIWGKDLGFRFV